MKGDLIMLYVIIGGILFVAWVIWLLFLDRGECIYCHKERWIPFGDEHLLCALKHHPIRALMGWYFWLLGQITRKDSYRRKERWLKRTTIREGNIIEAVY